MEKIVDHVVEHMAISHRGLADILDHNTQVSVRMANLIGDIPGIKPGFEDIETLVEHSLAVSRTIVAYLNSLADLQDAIVSNVSLVMKELNPPTGDE